MNSNTRVLLFLFLCIPIRLSFAYAARELNEKYIKYFRYDWFNRNYNFVFVAFE